VPERTVAVFAWVALLTLIGTSRAQSDETIPFVVQDALYRTNLAISNIEIPALGIINLKEVVSFAFGYPRDTSFEGFVRLRSTARIAAFASQIRNANGDPGIIPAMSEDASQFLLPITTSIEPWSSTLAVVNLAARGTTVKVSLRSESGSLLAEIERSLEGLPMDRG